MRVSGQKDGDKVFFFGFKVDNAHSSALLDFVFVRVSALHIAARRKDQDRVLLGNKVFVGNSFVPTGNDRCLSGVAVFTLDIFKLGCNDFVDFLCTCKKRFELCDQKLLFFELKLDCLAFKTGKLLEAHFQNSGCLEVGELELFDQVNLCNTCVF